MKHLTLAAIATILATSGACAADPLVGMWRTIPDDNGNSGLIEVKPCGSTLCGTLVKAFDSSGASVSSDQIGKRIISETVATGGGSYKGKVYSPDRDKTYNSKLSLSGNTLKVSGCVLGICRDGGTWSRSGK